ncbi:glycerophosphodiester phosphodiesterase [Nocardioides bruguierae]|uniref:Glycerophosphodiester phosphodiesterase n=1 Tax=Nocardioides bruguierae TaxID=2945102 RepID=A0A9X2IGR9_9ACTN|nr:glycerophosphodiester phosphodiesterase family protein [Nocardioides bruguierae]MCL8026804.1 glycerophosphodiester phosphodiesterase [Nocardioides bruguierae]MCM0621070.1 glycerophosphodiester phosphodiesterase [Nocardioides bruguierae]
MRPQVLAHRGASHDHAEHTLGAYEAALAQGADGLECDVRLTADLHLVCVHDRSTRRTTGFRGVVSTMDLATLSELDFASWKHPWAEMDDERPDLDPERGRVLTLRRLLEVVAAQDRPVRLAIETKHPTRYGGLVEKKVVELLREFGWDGPDSPVRVMSFSYTALQRVERMAPGLPLVQLIERQAMWPMLRQVVPGDRILGPGIELLREHPRLAKRLGDGRHELHVWTVNTEEDLRLCLDLGVTAVISDRPAHLRSLVDALPE